SKQRFQRYAVTKTRSFPFLPIGSTVSGELTERPGQKRDGGNRGGAHETDWLASTLGCGRGGELSGSGSMRSGGRSRGHPGPRTENKDDRGAEQHHRAQIRTSGLPGSRHLGGVTPGGV